MGIIAVRRLRKAAGLDRKKHHTRNDEASSSPRYVSVTSEADLLKKYMSKEFEDKNSELYLFFEKLFAYVLVIVEEDSVQLHDEAMKYVSMATLAYEDVKLQEKRLTELGIELSGQYSLTSFLLSDLLDGKKFDGYITFNGLQSRGTGFGYEITWLSSSKLRDELASDELLEQNLLSEKADLEKRLKFPFSKKDEIKRRLGQIESELKNISVRRSSNERDIKIAETYENLTEEQKEAISDYLKALKNCQKQFEKASSFLVQINRINSLVSEKGIVSLEERKKSDIYLRALNRFLNLEGVTPEYIKSLFSKIDEVFEKGENNLYGPFHYSMKFSFESLVSWFIDEVYFEDLEFIDLSSSDVDQKIQDNLDELRQGALDAQAEIDNMTDEIKSRRK